MLNRILVALILLLFLPGVFLTLADMIPAPHQEDFGAYYLAARALERGESPFEAQVAERLAAQAGVREHSPYIYPPLLALVLRPLAAVPYTAAAAVWFGLSAGALAASLWLLRPVAQLPWRRYRWVCAAAFFLPPVHHTLQHGQINHFLLLLIVAGAVGGMGAGAWVGVAAALKVFPSTLGLAYVLGGRIAGLAAMSGSLATLTLAGALAEPAATSDFVRQVGPRLAIERRLAPNNQSVPAVLARWFETQWFVTPIVDAPAVGRFTSQLATAIVIGLTLWTLIMARHARGETAHLRRFALVLAATLMVSPIVWDHYYVLLLLPAAVIWRSEDRLVRLLLLSAAVLLLSHRYWPLMFALKSPLFMSEGLAGVTALWAALLLLLRQEGRQPAAVEL